MIPLFKVFIPPDVVANANDILLSGSLNSGKYLSEFETKVRSFIGCERFLAVNSYNSAAQIVYELIGLKPGDEVIASPMSCLASNQPVAIKRAIMKWTDIDPLVGSLDPDEVRKNITKHTKAILFYQWGGYPGHIDEILQIGKDFGIPVIEDAIESFGSEYRGRKLGNTGADYTLYSFQPVRLPTTIDGGGIAFKAVADYEKAVLIRDYGIDRSSFRDYFGEITETCDISIPGFGATLNEFNAFIGSKSMDKVPLLLQKQKENSKNNTEYLTRLGQVSCIGLADSNPNYWIFTFLSSDRDNLLDFIRKDNIYASKVHLRNDYYSLFGSFQDKLTGVKKFSDETLSIPCGWWVTSNA